MRRGQSHAAVSRAEYAPSCAVLTGRSSNANHLQDKKTPGISFRKNARGIGFFRQKECSRVFFKSGRESSGGQDRNPGIGFRRGGMLPGLLLIQGPVIRWILKATR